MENAGIKQNLIRAVSVGLFVLTVVMTHFIFFIERYKPAFSEETIFGLYLWSWLPSLVNCVYCIIFFRDLPWWLRIMIVITPLIQILAISNYLLYGFGHMNWS